MSVIVVAPPIQTIERDPITPEEMLRLPDDGKLYELVDGVLVEKQVGDLAQLVANTLNDELAIWARRTNSGRSFVEPSVGCFPHDPGMVRRPDVAYFAASRLATYTWGRGHFAICPDIAVEVVSPNDEVLELDRKIHDCLRAGVRRVWTINPELQFVRIHRAMGDLSELVANAILSDEAVLPEFACPLATLFAQPTAPPLPA